jgi:PAS domain S-box-containing protein
MGDCASATPIPNIELFRDIFHASPVGIAVENFDGQPLFVNPALCSILGFTEDELLDKHCVQFSPREDAEKDWALFQKLRAGSIDHYQLEKRYFRRDGSLVWGSLSLSLMNSRPSPLVLAMVEDITEKKRAEEAQRESEERLRLAVQAGKMYAYQWDMTTNVLVRSPEYVNVLGATEPQILTYQQVLEKVHPDDRPILIAAASRHSLQSPTVDVTYRVLLHGKSPIWVKSSGRAFFNGEGKMLRIVGIVADITDQKLAEESLRASEERMRLAQKVAGIGTFERNIRTGVNTWTPEMESMYGLPPGGFRRTRAAFENLVHPDDRAQVVNLVEEALLTGRQMSGEWRVIWPDGSVHWIAARWQALMDESGEPSRVIGVDMDITDRKRAEEALDNMTRKLVDAQEQERARIARELHDDIGQRLALLTIDLDQVQQNWPDLSPEVLSHLQELRQQTRQISAGVQSLSHDLHSSQLEYLGIVRGMESWCIEFGKRQGIEIDCSHNVRSILSAEIGICLFRVLQEALHNAAKHSGVKRIEVELSEDEDSGEIHLTITDLGKGFDLEAVKQRKGLGLTSMRERIRLVNGTIAIESKPAAGTTIRVRVPLPSEQDSHRAAV